MLKSRGFVVLVLLVGILMINTALAEDVAYVYRKDYKIDDNVLDVFSSLNLSVKFINENSMPASFAGYKFIFVGDENFRKNVPVNKYPSVVINSFEGPTWGITDGEGVSQLAASAPMKVVKNGSIIQVYTQGVDRDGIAIPYYFLDDEDRAPAMNQIAGTYATQSGQDFGDVISYAQKGSQLFGGKTAGGKICFYGIAKSDYWTPAARQMFVDCVGFVGAQCFSNSECPGNSSSANYCKNDDVYKNVSSYTCNNPGQINSQCNAQTTNVLVEECSDYCSNGACQNFVCEVDLDCDDGNVNTQDICNDPSTPQASCSNLPIECFNNLDCGQTGYSNNFCSNDNVAQNVTSYLCNNPGTAQSYCSSSTQTNVSQLCPQGCANGVCINLQCSDNIDNDNDQLIDIVDPGCHSDGNPTNSSSYDPNDNNESNPPILCYNNLDCGTDGNTGSLYCSNDNVNQNYTSYLCNNPGTTNSYCSTNVSKVLNETCTDYCSNGACQNFVCEVDLDCDDGNHLTLDVCNNPSTPISSCSNTPINCAYDLDCGFNGFVGSEFCTVNDVYKNYQNATCNNPGTTSSSCSVSVSSQLVNDCQFSCSNGACVACNTNIQCDDGNNNTQDTCNNPGTAQAYCANDNIQCFSDLGCNDNNPLTYDQCINAGTVASQCRNTGINCNSDLDCGFNGFVGSEFCTVNDVYKNYQNATCNNPGTLNSYCDLNVEPLQINQCEFACYAGGCIVCDENLDCSDGNANTTDICNFAGTAQSYCSNTNIQVVNITCNFDYECGANGAVGDPYCSASNLLQNYTSSSCINAGTAQSYCSVTNSLNSTSCNYGCSNGQCNDQTFECSDGIDNDNDQLIDIVDPGCHSDGNPNNAGSYVPTDDDESNVVVSYACSDNVDNDGDNKIDIVDPGCHSDGNPNNAGSYVPTDNSENDNGIVCSTNSECGTTTIGGQYCSGSNVAQDTTSYICNNPGTLNSYCSTNTTTANVQSCSLGCSNGQCITDKCAVGQGYDSGWQTFTTTVGCCNAGCGGGALCAISAVNNYCNATSYGLSWMKISNQCSGAGYKFLCQENGGGCNLLNGMGMGQTVDVPGQGWYYIAVDADWDNGSTPENLFIGANDPYGGLNNRIAVADFGAPTTCVTKAGQAYLNSDPGKVWVDTTYNSGSVHVKKFRVSECLPSGVTTYCDGTPIN